MDNPQEQSNNELVQPTVPIDVKIKLLSEWIDTIYSDIKIMQECRAIDFAEYSKLKATTDGWLAKRMKTINRIDKKINERKKAIKEIEQEIDDIKVRPLPGILPALPPKEPKVKKITLDEIKPEDISTFEFTDEERAAMNEEARNN